MAHGNDGCHHKRLKGMWGVTMRRNGSRECWVSLRGGMAQGNVDCRVSPTGGILIGRLHVTIRMYGWRECWVSLA